METEGGGRSAPILPAGRDDRQQFEAALSWRRWLDVVNVPHTQNWLHLRVDAASCTGRDGIAPHRLDAARRLREAGAALGPDRTLLLHLCIVEDQPWGRIAAQFRVSDKTATERVVEALGALALHLAGEPVPPARSARFRNQARKLVSVTRLDEAVALVHAIATLACRSPSCVRPSPCCWKPPRRRRDRWRECQITTDRRR